MSGNPAGQHGFDEDPVSSGIVPFDLADNGMTGDAPNSSTSGIINHLLSSFQVLLT